LWAEFLPDFQNVDTIIFGIESSLKKYRFQNFRVVLRGPKMTEKSKFNQNFDFFLSF